MYLPILIAFESLRLQKFAQRFVALAQREQLAPLQAEEARTPALGKAVIEGMAAYWQLKPGAKEIPAGIALPRISVDADQVQNSTTFKVCLFLLALHELPAQSQRLQAGLGCRGSEGRPHEVGTPSDNAREGMTNLREIQRSDAAPKQLKVEED